MRILVWLALVTVARGSFLQEFWNAACKREHGTCDKDQYENLRLIALRSTGCRRFCQCAHASTAADGSVTYYWVAQICPTGTLFDDSLPAPVCNHEDSVQCSGAQQPDGDPCEQEHGTCNKYEYENVRLVALVSSGCQKFCQCAHASTELDGSVTYKWVEKTCPVGTLFDESLPAPVCNHANQVSCGARTRDYVDACYQELGTCNKFEYEKVRLRALRSSGCHNFCQCAHASTQTDGSVTYYWVEQACPKGTLFDESLPTPVCNHASDVTCGNVGSSDVSDGSNTCTAEHGTCNRYEYETVRLVALESSGCKKFCQCAHASTELDGSVTYKWVEKTCPDRTLFDESLPAPVCNHANQVTCGAGTLDSPLSDACLKEHGTCTKSEYEIVRLVALTSSGCQKFCQCAHASTSSDGSVTYNWVEQTCPTGTLFDSSLSPPVCNHADLVECNGGSEVLMDEIVCEDYSGTITCPTGQTIEVHFANYGRTQDDRICPDPRIQTTSCTSPNSDVIVKSRCNGKNSCVVHANNGVFGDPCYMTYKYLEVKYTCK